VKDIKNKYVGKWVALDEENRIVSFGDKNKVECDIKKYANIKSKYSIKLYNIIDIEISNIIKSLLINL